MKGWLAQWLGEWSGTLLLGGQLLLILIAGFVLQRLVARGLTRLATRYQLPGELLLPLRGALRWLIMGSALMLALEHVGVSAGVLWGALPRASCNACSSVAWSPMWLDSSSTRRAFIAWLSGVVRPWCAAISAS